MTEKEITLSGVEKGALTLSQADDPARPHLLTFTAEDGHTSSWRLGPLGLRGLTENNSPQNIAKLLDLAGGEDDADGVVELSEESARTRRSIENAELSALELAAENASDTDGNLLTERVSAYCRRRGISYPQGYQELRAGLSGEARRQRERHRAVLDRAEARQSCYAAAAVELAQGSEPDEQGQAAYGSSWLDRPEEERRRLIEEEAKKAGYHVD